MTFYWWQKCTKTHKKFPLNSNFNIDNTNEKNPLSRNYVIIAWIALTTLMGMWLKLEPIHYSSIDGQISVGHASLHCTPNHYKHMRLGQHYKSSKWIELSLTQAKFSSTHDMLSKSHMFAVNGISQSKFLSSPIRTCKECDQQPTIVGTQWALE